MTQRLMFVDLALALVAILAGATLVGQWRNRLAGLCIIAMALTGTVIGAVVLAGHQLTPLAAAGHDYLAVSVQVDALSAWFLVLIGLVVAPAALFGVRYVHGAAASRTSWVSFALFTFSMQLVVVADSTAAFLTAWELMALASLLLVLTDQARSAEARSAGIWYAAMTQFGFLVVAFVLLVLTVNGHSGRFAAMHAATTGMNSAAVSSLFVLTVLGFGSKAGVVPLHVWLPRAHPAAPSHVSAVMSGAMVSLGSYGILRIGIQILGPVQQWWGVVVLAIGALSALYGALRSVAAVDLKRLLAYSTTENIGLILIGVGAGVLLLGQGQPNLAAVAFAAALLHALNHAAFKTLLFLAAGSVRRATDLRDLDRLGGLASRMPATCALFGIGALSAAALPIGCGFVSEWLLLQSLVNGQAGSSTLTALVMPVAVAAVALTTGLALAAFLKAFGVGFLARPRSDAATAARESPSTMRVAMMFAAASVLALGLLPALLLTALDRATAALLPDVSPPLRADGLAVAISGTATVLNPPLIAALLAAFGVAIVLVAHLVGRGRRRDLPAWGCGAVRSSPRMQYTATSFAQPLVRVFDSTLQPQQRIDVVLAADAPLLETRVRFDQHMSDAIEDQLYQPGLAALNKWGTTARQIANGSVHRYLTYMLIALVVVLVVVAL